MPAWRTHCTLVITKKITRMTPVTLSQRTFCGGNEVVTLLSRTIRSSCCIVPGKVAIPAGCGKKGVIVMDVCLYNLSI